MLDSLTFLSVVNALIKDVAPIEMDIKPCSIFSVKDKSSLEKTFPTFLNWVRAVPNWPTAPAIWPTWVIATFKLRFSLSVFPKSTRELFTVWIFPCICSRPARFPACDLASLKTFSSTSSRAFPCRTASFALSAKLLKKLSTSAWGKSNSLILDIKSVSSFISEILASIADSLALVSNSLKAFFNCSKSMVVISSSTSLIIVEIWDHLSLKASPDVIISLMLGNTNSSVLLVVATKLLIASSIWLFPKASVGIEVLRSSPSIVLATFKKVFILSKSWDLFSVEASNDVSIFNKSIKLFFCLAIASTCSLYSTVISACATIFLFNKFICFSSSAVKYLLFSTKYWLLAFNCAVASATAFPPILLGFCKYAFWATSLNWSKADIEFFNDSKLAFASLILFAIFKTPSLIFPLKVLSMIGAKIVKIPFSPPAVLTKLSTASNNLVASSIKSLIPSVSNKSW